MNAPQSMPKHDQDVSPFAGHSRGLWIGGEWLPATGGGLIEIVDPSTEEVIDAVPDAAPLMVARARYVARSMLLLTKWTEPSKVAKLTPLS